jgi:hypothetical protein
MTTFKKTIAAAGAAIVIGLVASPGYACINGARQCLTHMVYVCSGGWWVVTQGVCHHADDAGNDKSALLHDRLKINVNYSKPVEGVKPLGN